MSGTAGEWNAIDDGDARHGGQAAVEASERDPRNVHALLVAANGHLRSGNPQLAVRLAVAAVKADPGSFAAVRALSGLYDAAGRRSDAIKAGLRAVQMKPADAEAHLHLGCLYACDGRWTDAVRHLAVHVASPDATASGWRMLSTALHESGRTERALEAIGAAIAVSPRDVEYRLHKASLLGARGRFGDALSELARAAAIAPGDARIWHASSAIHHVLGETPKAVADARHAVALSPGDSDLAAHLDMVLALSSGFTVEQARGAAASAPERWLTRPARRQRPPARRRGPAGQIIERARVVWALMLREMRTRHARSRLGYLWALAEPLTHLLTLGSVFAAMNHGPPPVGDNLFLFYLTGLLPYLMFSHVATEVASSVAANGSVLRLPVVRRMDIVAARALLHLATEVIVSVIAFSAAAALGSQGMPADPLYAVAAVGMLWVLAIGTGLVNMVITELFPAWDTIWNSLVRLLYFASGIYYSPMAMPEGIRELLSWNPVLQAVEMFRSAFYHQYDPHWVDPGYLAAWAVGAILIGMCTERALRSRIRVA